MVILTKNHQGWKSSPKPVTPGMYRTGKEQLINAGLKGAADIMPKAETQLG
ncbi:hypothetical protein IQ270_08390 [Microcoleus sp. LEGE 07076]|uniref:hypothetical protein n=1 Tax=Microcoleus sp. LEGE 07076 TaxID=915322 RepID=UPI0018822C3A|nr:hypothetical protein [Microcoleus sp. LEGE 07076]MBE9184734.1 hypothetical protein [Microcoleus sp. LEGE 07076]